MEVRHKYNEQIAEVHQNLLRMGALVEEALHKALVAVRSHDDALANLVIEGDKEIDAWQYRIEDQCTIIIATEQPVAGTLRELVTIIKIVSDLERIGDHARHLAKSVSKVSEAMMARVLPIVSSMTEKGISMLHQSLSALISKNPEEAKAIAAQDLEIDALHRELYSTVLKLMKEQPDKIEEGTSLIFLARFLERLGDHIATICSWIVFIQSGQHPESM